MTNLGGRKEDGRLEANHSPPRTRRAQRGSGEKPDEFVPRLLFAGFFASLRMTSLGGREEGAGRQEVGGRRMEVAG